MPENAIFSGAKDTGCTAGYQNGAGHGPVITYFAGKCNHFMREAAGCAAGCQKGNEKSAGRTEGPALLMHLTGLEPALRLETEPKSVASANSATGADAETLTLYCISFSAICQEPDEREKHQTGILTENCTFYARAAIGVPCICDDRAALALTDKSVKDKITGIQRAAQQKLRQVLPEKLLCRIESNKRRALRSCYFNL